MFDASSDLLSNAFTTEETMNHIADPDSLEIDAEEVDGTTAHTEINLSAKGLPGCVAARLLEFLKSTPKRWMDMTFEEQNVLIGKALHFGNELVDGIDRTIAKADRVVIQGTLVDYKHGDKKFEGKLDLDMSAEMAADLYRARGREVLVVVAGAGRFGTSDEDLTPDAPRDNQLDMLGDVEANEDGTVVRAEDDSEDEDDDKPLFDSTANGQDVAAEGTSRRRRGR